MMDLRIKGNYPHVNKEHKSKQTLPGTNIHDANKRSPSLSRRAFAYNGADCFVAKAIAVLVTQLVCQLLLIWVPGLILHNRLPTLT